MEEIIRPTEDELMKREEKCRKSIKTVGKALIMRLFITGLLVWILLRSGMELWVIGLMGCVMLITLGGMLPLWAELRKRTRELKDIMDQYE